MSRYASNAMLRQSLVPVDTVNQARFLHATRAAARQRLHGKPIIAAAVDAKGGARFTIPLVIPEGVESGDGRTFKENSLEIRDLPLPLMWQILTEDGHLKSAIVGRIDHVERTDRGLGNAFGVFDTGPYGQEAERLVRSGMLRWVSADLDQFTAKTKAGEPPEDAEELQEGEELITDDKMLITHSRLMGATLVAKPAFQECVISLDDQVAAASEEPTVYESEVPEQVVPALVASAAADPLLALIAAGNIPVTPPRQWFDDPKLARPTALTITDDGHVFGHIAAWDVDHIGMQFKQRPPRSATNYAYFNRGVVRTAEGDDVTVGQLTLVGGHASMRATAAEAVKHYDDTASAFADVHAGEDQYGIWVAGALRPTVTPEQIRAARASVPSGDWRPIKGSLELVAVCQVNVPGFPTPRALVAGGVVTALVAAGALPLYVDHNERVQLQYHASLASASVKALRDARAQRQAAQARTTLAAFKSGRDAKLRATAASARTRLNASLSSRALADEDDDKINEMQPEGLPTIAPTDSKYTPETQPRDASGKFRKVLARLKLDLGSDRNMQEAVEKIEEAEGYALGGDYVAAADAATDVITLVDKIDDGALNPDAITNVRESSRALGSAIANLPLPFGADAEKVRYTDLPPATRELVEGMIDRVIDRIGPEDAEAPIAALRAFMSGSDVFNQSEIQSELATLLRLLT